MLILRLTQVRRPGTTAHNYKIHLAKQYAAHPVMKNLPVGWQTVSWFMVVLRDMILWPIFFSFEIRRVAIEWGNRIMKRKVGSSWLNPTLRRLSRQLLRTPHRYEQLCSEAGIPHLATAINLSLAHPKRIPDLDNYVPESESPLAQVPPLVDALPPEEWEYPYLTGGYMRFREEIELWPTRVDRIADMLTTMRNRSLNKGPWGCSIFLARYATGLAEGWLPSEVYNDVVGFLAERVDGDQAIREATVAELLDGIGVVPSDVIAAELQKATTWQEQSRIYGKLGQIAEPTTPHVPVKTDAAEEVVLRA
jgi:hypothetical protein